MKKKIVRRIAKKQDNSYHCFVCGLENDKGLKARFYEVVGDEVVGVFTPHDMHQGYPGKLHGGVAASMLDEIIFRAFQLKDETLWCVTVDLQIKYRKPLPLGQELKAVGRITKESRLLYEGTGEIYTPDGEVAVSAWGKYMQLKPEQMAELPPEEIAVREPMTENMDYIEI